MKRYFITVFFVVLFSSFYAQTIDVNKRCKDAYIDIIALRFDDAEKLILNEKTQNPDNLFTLYLDNYIDFLKSFIGEDKHDYEVLNDNKSSRIEKLESLPDTNPYKNYLIANIRLQNAMAATKFGDYFSSALDIRRSFLSIDKNVRMFPDFQPQYSTMGVLHILVGMVPDKYNWILKLISMQGTVEQGKDELNKVFELSKKYSRYSYLKPEILFYVAFVEMNLGLDETNKQKLMDDLKPFAHNNLLLGFLRADMLMKSGDNDLALRLLERLNSLEGYFPFYYLRYLEGEAKLRKLDVEANKDYEYFLNNFKGKNYLKDAQRKIAWCYLLSGRKEGYLKNILKVKNVGDDFVGIDKEAEKEAGTGAVPNVDLLKSRLLFDGGYYYKSKLILEHINVDSLNYNQQLERLYRLGRIFQKINNFDKSFEYFTKTIEAGKYSKRYFAGNAALQLGREYEQRKNYKEALKFYNICRSLDFDEYETSIKEKAKQGIERINR